MSSSGFARCEQAFVLGDINLFNAFAGFIDESDEAGAVMFGGGHSLFLAPRLCSLAGGGVLHALDVRADGG